MVIDRYKVVADLDFERLAGSPGEERAREVITGYLADSGVEYTVEPFELNGFDAGAAEVRAAGTSVPATPYGLDSTATIEGELVYVENPEVISYNIGAFDGKIVVSFGRTPDLADTLATSKIKAYVAIGGPLKRATSLSHRQKRYEERLAVPCLTVTYEDGLSLARAGQTSAEIRIDQQVEKRTAHNVVVDLGEPEIDENLVYLVAHYDSVARSHGATDNAAGTACVLELIEQLAKHQPKRRLRAVLFSGEELGLLGSFAHVAMHEEEIRARGRFVLNLDVAGDPIGRDTLHVLGTRETAGYVGGIAREAGWALSEKLGVYSSDNVPFAVHEVPSVSIARGSGGGSYFIHTEDDVAKHVAPPGLDGPFHAGLTVLTRVLGAEVFPLKREIDDNLKDKLEKYLYRVRVEKPELKWRESYKKP